MKLRRKNIMGVIFQEEKLEIFIDNDSEIRKLLMIDKAVDLIVRMKLLKIKREKFQKIFI